MLGNWLDEFSTTAGGNRIYAPVGSGSFAFQRVLRETSAHYLLGVQPEEADRDGAPHQLNVKVDRPGVTVNGRQWVLIPARRRLLGAAVSLRWGQLAVPGRGLPYRLSVRYFLQNIVNRIIRARKASLRDLFRLALP